MLINPSHSQGLGWGSDPGQTGLPALGAGPTYLGRFGMEPFKVQPGDAQESIILLKKYQQQQVPSIWTPCLMETRRSLHWPDAFHSNQLEPTSEGTTDQQAAYEDATLEGKGCTSHLKDPADLGLPCPNNFLPPLTWPPAPQMVRPLTTVLDNNPLGNIPEGGDNHRRVGSSNQGSHPKGYCPGMEALAKQSVTTQERIRVIWEEIRSQGAQQGARGQRMEGCGGLD
ncbi:hypothetical protein DSO57_1017819 [Entomophthora muscae]|uniref:Uncharacterized protein n=1 Tax=Entomophthora muscae TaxID=34485 RepID=A0ACC2SHI1_9FUNG|nr:hypothetical protein DSO57_1017819 [Entomophthora muscae]